MYPLTAACRKVTGDDGADVVEYYAAILTKQAHLLARLISALPFISPPVSGAESVPPLCAALLFMC